MKILPDKDTLRRWAMVSIVSFVLYNALWMVVTIRFSENYFDIYETLCDLLSCTAFTTVSFVVDSVVMRFWRGKKGETYFKITLTLVVNILLLHVLDYILYGPVSNYDDILDVIDIYIILAISFFLSTLSIQHSYHEAFVEMKKEQDKIRLNMMQQQLSPHFIFNSLSTLKGLIREDQQKAAEYVGHLSGIMRYITSNIGKERVLIEDAMNFMTDYCDMLCSRFPCHFVFHIDERIRHQCGCILPISLQIALENAIKHNRHSASEPLEISLTLCDDAIAVSNKRQDITSEGLGVGLENLNARCLITTGKPLEMTETADSFTVKVPIISNNNSLT